MNIRRAAARDVDAVTSIYLTSRVAAGAMFPPNIHTDDEVREFVGTVVVAQRETWVAEVDGTPAGVLVLDGADIDWLHVAPSMQSHGVGSALLDHARSLRPNGVALWTYLTNTTARRFYEARGFVAVRETDGADNEDHAPDVRYAWGAHPENRPASQD